MGLTLALGAAAGPLESASAARARLSRLRRLALLGGNRLAAGIRLGGSRLHARVPLGFGPNGSGPDHGPDKSDKPGDGHRVADRVDEGFVARHRDLLHL